MLSSRNLLAVLATLGLAAASSAQQAGGLQLTNTGELRPVIFTGHVLTAGAADGASGILYAPSESDDATFRAAISAAAGGVTVDYFDARVATPDVATLSGYAAAHTWANFAYADNVTFGNNLAAYNDAGGSVVLGAFCTYTSGNFLSGTIMTSGYNPVVSPFGNNHFTDSAYAGDGTTCIYTGVTSLNCVFRDFLVTQGSGVVDGTYVDGEICHAYRGTTGAGQGQVVYSNGSGAFQLGGTGEWGAAVGNSATCLGAPTTNAWTDQGGGLAGITGIPLLEGAGDLTVGSQNSVDLSNAAPNELAGVLWALGTAPISFKGGTVLPGPLQEVFYGTTSGAGAIPITFQMPSGVPAGTEIWVQWGIVDAAAIKGVSLSNAISGLVP